MLQGFVVLDHHWHFKDSFPTAPLARQPPTAYERQMFVKGIIRKQTHFLSVAHNHTPLSSTKHFLFLKIALFSLSPHSASSNLFNYICFPGPLRPLLSSRSGGFCGGRFKLRIPSSDALWSCGSLPARERIRRGLEDLYLIRDTVSRQGPALTPSSAPRRPESGPHPLTDPN